MAGPIEATGPCEHGVVDDICDACTLDNYWRDIVAEIPSKHLRFDKALRAFGYRKHLA
ncbi:hypothetical protein LCGC14_3021610, partial [marine sediment metagenome]